jgi:hypothetical protein
VDFIAKNEMDTHADTSCAGENWSLMELTGELCDVNPFLASYQPVQEIPVARCCTAWTDQTDSIEYLLVGNQMLWFGTQTPNSLLNPNQMRAYGISVYDDPFDRSRTSGIDSDQAFIPFDTTGTIVHFESRVVPTEWEKTHLPIILLTNKDWNPSQEMLGNGDQSREFDEMRTIQSLTHLG